MFLDNVQWSDRLASFSACVLSSVNLTTPLFIAALSFTKFIHFCRYEACKLPLILASYRGNEILEPYHPLLQLVDRLEGEHVTSTKIYIDGIILGIRHL